MAKRLNPFLPTEGLKIISACPLCNVHYNPLQAHVIDQRDDAHLLHLECRNCGSEVVAAVLNDQVGVSSVGLITDLTSDDVLKFKDDASDVTVDDVIDLHAILAHDEHALMVQSV